MRPKALSFLLFLGVLLLTSCSENVVSERGSGRAGSLSLVPRFSNLGPESSFAAINRIRLTARKVSNNAIVADTTLPAAPEDQSWTIDFQVPPDAGTVIVQIELINVTNGVESVEFSGVTEPITVKPGESQSTPHEVPLLPGPPDNLAITSLSIAPDGATVVEGTTVKLGTVVIGGGANTKVYWSALDPAVATVDSTGLVSTLRNGSARIRAYAGAKADTVTINATQRVASLVISPDTQRISSIGGEAAFSARVLDPRGADIAGSGVTFAITNGAIADQVSAGRFRAKANGTTTITASSTVTPSITRSATLIVAQRAGSVVVSPSSATLGAVGATQAFTAVVKDANGNVMTSPVTWRSANTTVATIDAAGLATARASGATDIVATANAGSADSVSAHALLQVAQTVSTVLVSPSEMSLSSIGDTIHFTAEARDANNNVIPGLTAAWLNSNALIGSINASGNFTALSNGATVVSAVIGQARGNATVNIQQVANSILVSPAADSMIAGGTKQLAAVIRDARGNAMSGTVVWTSSDTSKATVSSTGVVTAKAAGSVTIQATFANVTGSATLKIKVGAQPNLVAAAITTVPADTVFENDSVRITMKVKNTGGSASTATTMLWELLAAAGNSPLDDSIAPLPPIAAGDSLVFTIVLRIDNAGTMPDSLKLRLTVDNSGHVAESNELDNQFTSTTKFLHFLPRTWTGATSTAWLEPTNWSPAGAPRASIDVTIPRGTPHYPVLTSNSILRSLDMDSSTTLDLGAFNLMATGTSVHAKTITGTGTVILTGLNTDVIGEFPNLSINNGAIVGGYPLNVSGNVAVGGGDFDLNNVDVNVGGNFATVGSGALKITSGGEINVDGDVSFNGGSTAGKITTGSISLSGNFSAGTTAASFAATGSNTVYMGGSVPHTLSLSNPDTTANSQHFANLYISNNFGTTLTSNLTILTELGFGYSSAPLVGNGRTTILLGNLEDDVADGGSYLVSNTIFARPNLGMPHALNTNAVFTKQQTLANDESFHFLGDVTVSGGDLRFNLNSVIVDGSFSTVNGGTLYMADTNDDLKVYGNTSFAGGSTDGALVNGKIEVFGHFSASGDPHSFAASGDHTVWITSGEGGPAVNSISMSAPGISQQRFANLTIDHDADLATDIAVAGTLDMSSGYGILTGVGKTLTSTGDISLPYMCLHCANVPQAPMAAKPRLQAGARPAVTRSAQADARTKWSSLAAQPKSGLAANAAASVVMDGVFPYLTGEVYRVDNTVLAGSTQMMPEYITTNLTIASSVNFGDACGWTEVNGNVTITGTGSNLLMLCDLYVDGAFATANGGTLEIGNPSCDCSPPELGVRGNVTFNGGSEAGKLMHGSIFMPYGDLTFSAGANPEAFLSEGTLVDFSGANVTVSLAHPDTQHFFDVSVSVTGGITIPGGMVTDGYFEVSSPDTSALTSVNGSGVLLAKGGFYVNYAQFNGITVDADAADFGVSHVTFGTYPANVDQLIVRADTGSAGITYATFTTVPDSSHYWLHTFGGLQFYVYYPTPSTPDHIHAEGTSAIFWGVPSDVVTPPVTVRPARRN